MSKITDDSQFKTEIVCLPLEAQRRLAARFIEQVLDLVDDNRVTSAVEMLAKSPLDADSLARAYSAVHSCYVETHPRSDQVELDFTQHARHLVTEACMVALAPVFEGKKELKVALKAAIYCRMARTCAGMKEAQENGDLNVLGGGMQEHIESQFRMLEEASGA